MVNTIYLKKMSLDDLQFVLKGITNSMQVIEQFTGSIATLGVFEAVDPNLLMKLEHDHEQYKQLSTVIVSELQRRSKEMVDALVTIDIDDNLEV